MSGHRVARGVFKHATTDVQTRIGECKPPFNLHANVLFHPEECEDPILCEVQIYPRAVYDLQHRQHLAYELRRAKGVEDLV